MFKHSTTFSVHNVLKLLNHFCEQSWLPLVSRKWKSRTHVVLSYKTTTTTTQQQQQQQH